MKKVLIGFQVAIYLLGITEIKASDWRVDDDNARKCLGIVEIQKEPTLWDLDCEVRGQNLDCFVGELMHDVVKALHEGRPNVYVGFQSVSFGVARKKTYGETPLTAVIKHMPQRIEWALQKGCDPNLPFRGNSAYVGDYYPLYLARCRIGDIKLREEVFALLFQYGADKSLCPRYNDREECVFQ